MKIAIIYDMSYPFNVGGVEVRNYQMAKYLSLNHDVHFFSVKMWDGPDIIKKDNITYHGVCRYSKMYNFDGARTTWEPIKFAFKLFRPLYKEKFDVIDTSSFVYFHCFTCKAISVLKKTPLVFTWHQYWGDYWDEYVGGFRAFVGKIMEKMVKNLTQNHIAVSFTTKNDLVAAGVPQNNIAVIYNGVDLENVAKSPLADQKFDILFVGRLTHQKNVKLLIESVNLIKNNYPTFKVGIIGDGPNREELVKKTKKLNLEKNIDFLGFLEDLSEVYSLMKNARIFVLPSLLEGFGIVVVEANACGLPAIVIKNKWNAANELVTDQENGFVVENTAEALAFKIIELLENEELRSAMSARAREFASDFAWQKLAKKLEQYYLRKIPLK